METVLVDPDQSLIAYSRLTSSTPSPSRTISFSTRLKAAAQLRPGMVAVAVVDVLETDAALRQRVSRLLPPGLRTGFPSRGSTAAPPS